MTSSKKGDDAFAAQLNTFKSGIGSYATLFNLSAPEVAAQAADAAYFTYVLECQKIAKAFAQQWTAWKNIVRDGGTPPVGGIPVAPVFPTAVPAVEGDIEGRHRDLAARLKSHKNYNVGIGEILDIEGASASVPKFDVLKPKIGAKTVGDTVHIDWSWQGHHAFLQSCEIQVDRGQGWTVLTFDTTPGYVDTHPFPAAPAKWSYRAIYHRGDAQTGHWSDTVTVNVG